MNLGKESEALEFEKTTSELKEAMISISSILNKHGVGTLYFGVKTNGDVVGQDVSESSLRDVSRVVYESIKPQIYPVIQEEILDDHHVIKVEFYGEDYPYSAAEKHILKNINWRSEIVGMERGKIPEIPVAAVGEILANSYAHAVYNNSTYHEMYIP